MMTGTLTGSNLPAAYLLIVLLCITGFALYDNRYRRVPNRALLCFLPLAIFSPLLQLWLFYESFSGIKEFLPVIANAISGALFGFAIPLAAALVSSGGMGGGDIKFCAILGLIYGISGMALIFLTAAFLAMPAALILRRFGKRNTLSLPFVPFLTCGCLIETMLRLL